MAVSVGFIGVGNMGNPMAANVLGGGFPVIVFDRHPPAMENLLQAGAKRGVSAQDGVEHADIVLSCLPASPDVEALYLDPGGLVDRARPGTILVDLSSVLPSTPRKIEPQAQSLYTFDLAKPTAIVLGNEHRGISREAAAGADALLYIPMMGMVESVNVSVASAICLFEALRQRMAAGMYDSLQLPVEQFAALNTEWSRK